MSEIIRIIICLSFPLIIFLFSYISFEDLKERKVKTVSSNILM